MSRAPSSIEKLLVSCFACADDGWLDRHGHQGQLLWTFRPRGWNSDSVVTMRRAFAVILRLCLE